MMQSEDSQWMDPLLWELAADLGGQVQSEAPVQDISSAPIPAIQLSGYYAAPVAATCTVMQQPAAPVQIEHTASLPASIGSPHDAAGVSLAHSYGSMNHLNLACYGSGQQLQQQPLMFDTAFGGNAASAAAAAIVVKPAGSNSPSSSSGGPLPDDYIEMSEHHRVKKSMNKGALAQKRFRERQKEKMRQSEQQVAELTQQLDMLHMAKARLESRARLLEQVVSLNLTHEARLHTNREIMVREQEMLLEELAGFVHMLDGAGGAFIMNNGLQALLLDGMQQQQPQQQHLPVLGSHQQQFQQQQQQQQRWLDLQAPLQRQSTDANGLLQQQQQQQHGSQANGSGASLLTQALRHKTVQAMTDNIFPHYMSRLQQLLQLLHASGSSSVMSQPPTAVAAGSPAAAAMQEVSQLVLRWREMTDRHALFSHYHWAIWCLNRSDMESAQLTPPPAETWKAVLQQLSLSKGQANAIVAARASLLAELQRVAAEWQKVLPTLALQLLQVPKEQWHTVAAVQAMVANLAAEREAVVAFLHTFVDEVLTPQQEGQLEASSHPWCPDVWALAGYAAHVSYNSSSSDSGSSGGSSGRGSKASKNEHQAKDALAMGPNGASNQQDGDPMATLAMGTDVLQPLMPFMTAFQLLRAPITARGAGLRLKRALLLDPFRTVVPAAAFTQPTAAEVSQMSLLDAHCGAFQNVMLWDWLKANLPGYLALPGLNPADGKSAAAGGVGATGGLVSLGSGGLTGTVGFAGFSPKP